MNRQRFLLAILAGVLVLSLVYAFWATPRQQQAAPRAAAPAAKPTARAGKVPKPKVVTKEQTSTGRLQLQLLEGDNQPFPGSGRDIFRFNSSWTPVPENVAPEVVEKPPPPPPPPPPTPEEVLSKDLSAYKVTGSLEKRGVRCLFLTDGKDIFVIKAGEQFGPRKRFIASEITATELVVSEVKNRAVTVRLPMSDVSGGEPAVLSPVSVPRPEVAPEPPAEPPADQPGRRLRSGAAGAAPGESQPEGVRPAIPEKQMQTPSGEEE